MAEIIAMHLCKKILRDMNDFVNQTLGEIVTKRNKADCSRLLLQWHAHDNTLFPKATKLYNKMQVA